jgi:hypothetical protein
MGTITATWTDNVTVATWAIIKAETYRTVTGLDLRTKRGGWLKLAIAAGGTTALTASSALTVKVYRTLNNDGANSHNGTPYFQGDHTALGKALVNGAVSAGVTSIAYDGAAGTAFAQNNTVCIIGNDTLATATGAQTVNHGAEWLKISKGAATPITFTTPAKYDHHDNEIICLASAWEIWLEGGSAYALECDHLQDIASEAMLVNAMIQTYDVDTTA